MKERFYFAEASLSGGWWRVVSDIGRVAFDFLPGLAARKIALQETMRLKCS